METIDKATIPPSDGTLHRGTWHEYKKVVLTKARRMRGPFTVKTREGVLTCKDGYLCLDNDGEPYPVDREVFHATYARL